MNLNNHFGSALKKYLENNGYNKSWLAREMDITPQAVTALFVTENPRQNRKERVLKALKITEGQLFEIEEKIDYKKKYEEERETSMMLREQLIKYQAERIEVLQESNS